MLPKENCRAEVSGNHTRRKQWRLCPRYLCEVLAEDGAASGSGSAKMPQRRPEQFALSRDKMDSGLAGSSACSRGWAGMMGQVLV